MFVDMIVAKLPEHRQNMHTIMDITACHNHGCPLDLEAMATSTDRFSVIHDVGGISANINRDTGKLENFFVPRFAKREVQNENK